MRMMMTKIMMMTMMNMAEAVTAQVHVMMTITKMIQKMTMIMNTTKDVVAPEIQEGIQAEVRPDVEAAMVHPDKVAAVAHQDAVHLHPVLQDVGQLPEEGVQIPHLVVPTDAAHQAMGAQVHPEEVRQAEVLQAEVHQAEVLQAVHQAVANALQDVHQAAAAPAAVHQAADGAAALLHQGEEVPAAVKNDNDLLQKGSHWGPFFNMKIFPKIRFEL